MLHVKQFDSIAQILSPHNEGPRFNAPTKVLPTVNSKHLEKLSHKVVSVSGATYWFIPSMLLLCQQLRRPSSLYNVLKQVLSCPDFHGSYSIRWSL